MLWPVSEFCITCCLLIIVIVPLPLCSRRYGPGVQELCLFCSFTYSSAWAQSVHSINICWVTWLPLGQSFFCTELAFSERELPIQQAIFGPHCAEQSGGVAENKRKIRQWSQRSWEGMSDRVDICFHCLLVCFGPTFTPVFLMIAMEFSFVESSFPPSYLSGFKGRQATRAWDFRCHHGETHAPLHGDHKTGRMLAESYDDSLHWKLMVENEDNTEESRVKRWIK